MSKLSLVLLKYVYASGCDADGGRGHFYAAPHKDDHGLLCDGALQHELRDGVGAPAQVGGGNEFPKISSF